MRKTPTTDNEGNKFIVKRKMWRIWQRRRLRMGDNVHWPVNDRLLLVMMVMAVVVMVKVVAVVVVVVVVAGWCFECDDDSNMGVIREEKVEEREEEGEMRYT
ncbi:hypothetical protein E2C01_061255 [Portunus trituberculatus]|uniref:Transmembrane protein n=1 Tax=Portunus trituberculatus TaxID=210409 RepID=A0A5B7H4P6_PORTR|nr:hypothetical protein [Portunus trituberculatus]